MPATVLIVDDEPHLRDMLGIAFKRDGFEVAIANDGEDALARVGSEPERRFLARRLAALTAAAPR